MPKRVAFVLILMLLVGASVPAGAEPKGFVREGLPYGYFYGTFGETPELVLIAGGSAEEFCPEGFDGTPGIAASRVFVREDGSVDVKVNDKSQPIHLYEVTADAMAWIGQVCSDIALGGEAPAPMASGFAKLKVRDSYLFDGGPPVHLFNSVNGKATGPDGTRFKVKASADIPFENGVPVGTPPDWVSFSLKQIGN